MCWWLNWERDSKPIISIALKCCHSVKRGRLLLWCACVRVCVWLACWATKDKHIFFFLHLLAFLSIFFLLCLLVFLAFFLLTQFLLFKSINIPSIHGIRTITHWPYAEGIRGYIADGIFVFNKSLMGDKNTHQHSSYWLRTGPTVPYVNKAIFSFMIFAFPHVSISNDASFE